MSKVITVIIDENGDQSVDLIGYSGQGCAAVQKAFADAVGASVKVDRKPEYNRPLTKQNTLKR